MTAMSPLLTRRNAIFVAIGSVVVVALLAVVAWTAIRGGRASIDGRTVQAIVQDDLLAFFQETLSVNEAEARDVYTESMLLEKAEDQDLTREEFLSRAREVATISLQEAVDRGQINTDQAERGLRMVMRALTNHL